jgi:hypothetical protein
MGSAVPTSFVSASTVPLFTRPPLADLKLSLRALEGLGRLDLLTCGEGHLVFKPNGSRIGLRRFDCYLASNPDEVSTVLGARPVLAEGGPGEDTINQANFRQLDLEACNSKLRQIDLPLLFGLHRFFWVKIPNWSYFVRKAS